MKLLLRSVRLVLLIFFAVVGTSALMYTAPGYFTNASEMDAVHAANARAETDRLRVQQESLLKLMAGEMKAWSRGDLGQSRQYALPVVDLLRERMQRSLRLLLGSVAAGWLLALSAASLLSGMKRRSGLELAVAVSTSSLLAVPIGALATVCLVRNVGGPALVLMLAVAVRDFKLIHRVLRTAWSGPHVAYARACGLPFGQIITSHVFRETGPELLSVTFSSFTLAMSALVPVEVVFDYPGVGQLAWSAAMNRDLPVLVASTALVAGLTGILSWFVQPSKAAEALRCA